MAGSPWGATRGWRSTTPAWPCSARWRSVKGLAAVAIVLLLVGLPRELSVLALAGVLLLSRRLHARSTLGWVYLRME